MENSIIDPSHEEVWDDSVLIDSWNQALEEYKKYHSIHANGGSIRDTEKLARPVSLDEPEGEQSSGQHTDTILLDIPVEERQTQGEEVRVILGEMKQTITVMVNYFGNCFDDSVQKFLMESQAAAKSHNPMTTSNSIQPPVNLPPQAILGSVRDENLKKLLMSWYYAGYYTGLFEGQQQAQQQQT